MNEQFNTTGAYYDGQWVDGVMNGIGEHGTAQGGSGLWLWKDGNTSEFIKRYLFIVQILIRSNHAIANHRNFDV